MDLIYGMNSVKELLRQDGGVCEKIIIASGRKEHAIKEIVHLASVKNIPVEFYPKKQLDKLSDNNDHQGIVCFCKKFAYAELDDILKNRTVRDGFGLVLVLDSVMDPHNLGSIIRTAYCLGADGVVIPGDRAAKVTATVSKTSAGSVWQIPVAKVINLSQTVDYFKDQGFWIVGAEARAGENIREMDFKCDIALVLGGEAKGIRPLIKKKCDFFVNIPMIGNFNSLNVSVAAGIILYEIVSQRRTAKNGTI